MGPSTAEQVRILLLESFVLRRGCDCCPGARFDDDLHRALHWIFEGHFDSEQAIFIARLGVSWFDWPAQGQGGRILDILRRGCQVDTVFEHLHIDGLGRSTRDGKLHYELVVLDVGDRIGRNRIRSTAGRGASGIAGFATPLFNSTNSAVVMVILYSCFCFCFDVRFPVLRRPSSLARRRTLGKQPKLATHRWSNSGSRLASTNSTS